MQLDHKASVPGQILENPRRVPSLLLTLANSVSSLGS